MDYWQLGDQDRARAAFDRGCEWSKGYRQRWEEFSKTRGGMLHPHPALVKRLQAEAETMLGITSSSVGASSGVCPRSRRARLIPNPIQPNPKP